MDNMDDPETNAKISDSGYSNSCSNSQSRRSHSSKSTHSGSNSSGSSGYGGKPSTSGISTILGQPPKKDKESKKKKLSTESKTTDSAPVVELARPAEPDPIFAEPKEESINVVESTMVISLPAESVDDTAMDICVAGPSAAKEESLTALQPVSTGENNVASPSSNSSDGFFCVISMHNGVVMYTSASLTSSIGFPKDIWIGRSFIDFVHPKDHKTFASLITNGLALPKMNNKCQDKAQGLASGSTMVCRIRRYQSLNFSFKVKDKSVSFMPFLLKFFFKDFKEDEDKVVYLVIQAIPFYSAFKTPNELVLKPVSFVIRHSSDGVLEYIDPESIPYLGYLPQDIQDRNALLLYHPDDLPYLRQVYENIVKEGKVSSSKTHRVMAQNGDYIKVRTEWSSFVNPWSMKLEFVVAKHHIVEGPTNPDVFQSLESERKGRRNEADHYRIQAFRDSIIRIMKEVRTKPAEAAKQQMGKRCQDLENFMESLIEGTPKQEEELRLDLPEIQDRELSYYERDSVMLGGISPHHDSDSKSSVETPLSYNQLNYNENLQRYFDSLEPFLDENEKSMEESNEPSLRAFKPSSSKCHSSAAQNLTELNEMGSNSSAMAMYARSPPAPARFEYLYVKLTENMIHKHNCEMENNLVKMHRESRFSKEEREKAYETRKKKKEHLARCNASYHPTSAGETSPVRVFKKENLRGVKRASKPQRSDSHEQKHHCPSPFDPYPSPNKPKQNVAFTATSTAPQWSAPQNVSSFQTFNMGLRQPMQMLAHMPALSTPTVIPALPRTRPSFVPEALPGTSSLPMSANSFGSIPATSSYVPGMSTMTAPPAAVRIHSTDMAAASVTPMPFVTGVPLSYMVHGHPISLMYGQPFVYSPINSAMLPLQQHVMTQQTMQRSNALNLTTSNYEQACKLNHLPMLPKKNCAAWKEKRRAENLATYTRPFRFRSNYYHMKTLRRTSDNMGSSSTSHCGKSKKTHTSDENAERTDEESSYSSFYSSFFQTDSGSAEDSGDQKNKNNKGVKNRFWSKNVQGEDGLSFQSSSEATSVTKPRNSTKLARRKIIAPWNEQVNLTSELIYKYQLVTKPVEEVLVADKNRILAMEQPSLVNEQLGQLYLDLQLQGVAARLTLEEGITSSSSSGEENSPRPTRVKRKREFSKLAIIHEENAPLPTPGSGPVVPESSGDELLSPTTSYPVMNTT